MKQRYMKILMICAGAFAVLLTGCSKTAGTASYHEITQEEAKEMMKKDDGHIIVDVRTREEYREGHIPDAICIPVEEIGEDMPAELPDREQVILVYCRSGRRSKQASRKLAGIGYVNVYEFGGITEWTGDVTAEKEAAVAITASLVAEINGIQFPAELADTDAAHEFAEHLNRESLDVTLHDYGNFEKTGELPWSLKADDVRIETKAGDVLLYCGNQICIYYDENTWEFTRLAQIHIRDYEQFRNALGEGDAHVRFWLEWSE